VAPHADNRLIASHNTCHCYAWQVLDDFQNDPTAAQRHLQRPEIMANIQKLVKAGIVKLG